MISRTESSIFIAETRDVHATLVPVGRARLYRWLRILGVAAAAATLTWLLYRVGRSPHSTDLATYWALVVPLVVLVASWFRWAGRQTDATESALDDENLDRAADLLAAAVKSQWEEAAGERGLTGADPIDVPWGTPSVPMAGPVAAAVGSHRFDPLPELARIDESQVTAGKIDDLHTVYGGLGSGRLIIAGSAGSGKSGAAVLLVLAALDHREQVLPQDRPKVPVLVLVSGQEWDPRHQSVVEWLIRQLQGTYRLLTGAVGAATAAALVAAGKRAVVVDGLEEIDENLRPVALQALSQQASFRVVVLSRTAAIAAAAANKGILQGSLAIELGTVDSTEAVAYLKRVQLDPPPMGWGDLLKRIHDHPASPLSKALANPLALTLVRDTYQSGDDVRELLEFCDAILVGITAGQAVEAITDYLLDRVLPVAYAHQPGQPSLRYDLPTAQNALIKIASHMTREGMHNLQWWRIRFWASSAECRVMSGLVFGVVYALGSWIGYALVRDHPNNIYILAKAVTSIGPAFWVTFGLLYGFATGLYLGDRERDLRRPMNRYFLRSGTHYSLSPVSSWRANWKLGFINGLAASTFGAFFGAYLGSFLGRTIVEIYSGVAGALVMAIQTIFLTTETWVAFLASIQLAIRWHTPVRLIKFLEDARRRNVLRTVGSSYQFRHARLQYRLAAAVDHGKKQPEQDK